MGRWLRLKVNPGRHTPVAAVAGYKTSLLIYIFYFSILCIPHLCCLLGLLSDFDNLVLDTLPLISGIIISSLRSSCCIELVKCMLNLSFAKKHSCSTIYQHHHLHR